MELSSSEVSFAKFDVERDIGGRLLSSLDPSDFSLKSSADIESIKDDQEAVGQILDVVEKENHVSRSGCTTLRETRE